MHVFVCTLVLCDPVLRARFIPWGKNEHCMTHGDQIRVLEPFLIKSMT